MGLNGNNSGSYFEKYISSETAEGRQARERFCEFFTEHKNKHFLVSELCNNFLCNGNSGMTKRDISDVVLYLANLDILDDVSRDGTRNEHEYVLAVDLQNTYWETVLDIVLSRGETPLLKKDAWINDCERILSALGPIDNAVLDDKVVARFNTNGHGKSFKGIGIYIIEDGKESFAPLKRAGEGKKYISIVEDKPNKTRHLEFVDNVNGLNLVCPAYYPITKSEYNALARFAGATAYDVKHGKYEVETKHFVL